MILDLTTQERPYLKAALPLFANGHQFIHVHLKKIKSGQYSPPSAFECFYCF